VALNLFIELAKCAFNQQRKQDQDLRISVDAIVERLVEISQYFETSSDKDAVSKSIKIDHAYWQRDQEKLLVMERMKRNKLARMKYAGGASADVETERDLFTEGPSSIPTTESDMIVLLKDELLSLKNQLNNESNWYQSKLDEMNQQIVVYKAKNDSLERELQETKEAYQALKEENSALKQIESTKAAATSDADELLEQQPDDTVDNPTLGSKTTRPACSIAGPPPPPVASISQPANGGNSSALSGDNNKETMGDKDIESNNTPSSGASLESSKVALQANPPTVDEVCRATDNLDVSSTNEDEADDGDATGSENDIVSSNVRRAPTTIIRHHSPPVREVLYVNSASRVQEEVDDDSTTSSGAANTGMTLDYPQDMASIGDSSNISFGGCGNGELEFNTASRRDNTSQQDELGDDQSEDDSSDHDTDSNKNSTSDSESDSSVSSSSSDDNADVSTVTVEHGTASETSSTLDSDNEATKSDSSITTLGTASTGVGSAGPLAAAEERRLSNRGDIQQLLNIDEPDFGGGEDDRDEDSEVHDAPIDGDDSTDDENALNEDSTIGSREGAPTILDDEEEDEAALPVNERPVDNEREGGDESMRDDDDDRENDDNAINSDNDDEAASNYNSSDTNQDDDDDVSSFSSMNSNTLPTTANEYKDESDNDDELNDSSSNRASVRREDLDDATNDIQSEEESDQEDDTSSSSSTTSSYHNNDVIQVCEECGMTREEAREAGMSDAGFDRHMERCEYRENIKNLKAWRKKHPYAKKISPTKTPKLNKMAYDFVKNLKHNRPTGKRLEELKLLLEGCPTYLAWITGESE